MRQKIFRRPSPGTVLAFMALVVVAAPIAFASDGSPRAREAATKKKKSTVVARAKRADTATNATKVGGYKVSFTPKANTIPVIGANGKLPASIIPGGGSGSNGNQGPQGPQGPAGPSGGAGQLRFSFQHENKTAGCIPDGGGVMPPSCNNGLDTGKAVTGVAWCDPGFRVSGGGYEDDYRDLPAEGRVPPLPPPGSTNNVQVSKPVVDDNGRTGWQVRMVNVAPPVIQGGTTTDTLPGPKPGAVNFTVWAVCTQAA